MALGLGSFGGISKWIKTLILNTEERVDDLELYKYNVDQSIDGQTIIGDIVAEGYITGIKIGLFRYITEPAETNLNGDDAWEHLMGTFNNDPAYEFIDGTDINELRCIIYTGDKTQYMKIDYHAVFVINVDTSTISFGIKHNGLIFNPAVMTMFCIYKDENYSLSGTAVILLAYGDTIQIAVSSDNRMTLIAKSFTTTINEFFD